jgi:hypothetical protein
MSTGFITNDSSYNGVDLSTIFKPLGTLTAVSYKVGYKPNQSNYPGIDDLNGVFAAINGATAVSNVGYKSNGVDLSQIFQSINYNPITTITISDANANITSSYSVINNYNVYTFTNSGVSSTSLPSATCNISVSSTKTVNVILVGGGGGGGFGNSNSTSSGGSILYAGGGGGGGGSSIKTSITLIAGYTYSLTVGSGGVFYYNSYSNGQASSITGSNISGVSASGGLRGGDTYSTASQSGGSGGTNGGNGGAGGNTPASGSNGTSYTTDYGVTLNVGGGGGGGYSSNTYSAKTPHYGGGHGGSNEIGGSGGTKDTYPTNPNGSGYGAGGGGGGGTSYSSIPQYIRPGIHAGGYGSNGVVFIYFS